MTQEEYLERLILRRSDQSSFGDMQHALSSPVLFEKLAKSFELLADFKSTYAAVLKFSYTKNMELKVLAHDMAIATLPDPNLWKSIQLYGSSKLRLQP